MVKVVNHTSGWQSAFDPAVNGMGIFLEAQGRAISDRMQLASVQESILRSQEDRKIRLEDARQRRQVFAEQSEDREQGRQVEFSKAQAELRRQVAVNAADPKYGDKNAEAQARMYFMEAEALRQRGNEPLAAQRMAEGSQALAVAHMERRRQGFINDGQVALQQAQNDLGELTAWNAIPSPNAQRALESMSLAMEAVAQIGEVAQDPAMAMEAFQQAQQAFSQAESILNQEIADAKQVGLWRFNMKAAMPQPGDGKARSAQDSRIDALVNAVKTVDDIRQAEKAITDIRYPPPPHEAASRMFAEVAERMISSGQPMTRDSYWEAISATAEAMGLPAPPKPEGPDREIMPGRKTGTSKTGETPRQQAVKMAIEQEEKHAEALSKAMLPDQRKAIGELPPRRERIESILQDLTGEYPQEKGPNLRKAYDAVTGRDNVQSGDLRKVYGAVKGKGPQKKAKQPDRTQVEAEFLEWRRKNKNATQAEIDKWFSDRGL